MPWMKWERWISLGKSVDGGEGGGGSGGGLMVGLRSDERETLLNIPAIFPPNAGLSSLKAARERERQTNEGLRPEWSNPK